MCAMVLKLTATQLRDSLPMRLVIVAVIASLSAFAGGCANRLPQQSRPQTQATNVEPYQQDTILREAETFFGRGAQGVADVLNRVFTDNGPPEAYIKGEEGGGAVGVGLRYGHGTVYFRDGTSEKVYWRGPSLGLDFGGSAAKTFVLIYNIASLDELYQRFGGVEGSLYFIGGVGVNYNRQGEVILAPVRFGLGWRQGVSVGYLHVSPDRSWIPF
jgi:hypothetical protein